MREPYRIFFPLGVVLGMIGAGHWLLYGVSWIPSYSGFYHASVQVWLFMACFVIGFLGTAVPKFTGSPSAGAGQIVLWLAGLGAVFVGLTGSRWLLAEAGFIFLMLATVFFLARCFLRRGGFMPPAGFLWMPAAVFHAILGTALLALGQMGRVGLSWQSRGRMMEEQGFLMCLVLGVGSFLGPRLLGEENRLGPKKLLAMHILGIPVFFLSFFLEPGVHEFWAYGLRGAVVFLIFYFSGALTFKTPAAGSFFSKLLASAFWMFPFAFWLVAANLSSKVLFFHVLFIGAFSYLTFLIATMVVLSHAGEGARIREGSPWVLTWIFCLTGVSLAVRLLSPGLGAHYFTGLAVAAALWILMGIGWLVFSVPYLLKTPYDDRVEKLHAAMLGEKGGHAC